ncbi:MAG: hypothetical protein IJT01_05190 [Selenomonadaceae bacterium]|nr:hypothetical protein [Selenomonadaceae bacterium]
MQKEDPGQAQRRLEDTQSLPPVSEDEEIIQPPFPQQSRSVRELERLPLEGEKKTPARHFRKRHAFLILAVFLFALFCGFLLAGYAMERSEQAEKARIQQALALEQKQKQLEAEESSLIQKRKQLEQERKDLEKRRQEIAQDFDRAKKKNDQLSAEAPDSALGHFFDKITGKEKERKEAIQENKQRQAQAVSDADSIDQSIADAQEMLEEVNSKLETVAEMKREADQMKAKVEAAYEENKDLIDTILYYVSEGLKSVNSVRNSVSHYALTRNLKLICVLWT